jgi:hypothetical protein
MGSDRKAACIMSGETKRALQDAIVQLACCSPVTLRNIEQEIGYELEALEVAGFKWTDRYNARAALQRLVKVVVETTDKLELATGLDREG